MSNTDVSVERVDFTCGRDSSVTLSDGKNLSNLTYVKSEQQACGLQKFKIEGYVQPKQPPKITPKDQAQKQIDEIMDWFDFGKVSRVMEALDWGWVDSGEVEIPDEPTLREKARELLQKAYEVGQQVIHQYTVATGGFYATYYPEDGQFKLVFQVAQWENTR